MFEDPSPLLVYHRAQLHQRDTLLLAHRRRYQAFDFSLADDPDLRCCFERVLDGVMCDYEQPLIAGDPASELLASIFEADDRFFRQESRRMSEIGVEALLTSIDYDLMDSTLPDPVSQEEREAIRDLIWIDSGRDPALLAKLQELGEWCTDNDVTLAEHLALFGELLVPALKGVIVTESVLAAWASAFGILPAPAEPDEEAPRGAHLSRRSGDGRGQNGGCSDARDDRLRCDRAQPRGTDRPGAGALVTGVR
jgi:hypothetical protein